MARSLRERADTALQPLLPERRFYLKAGEETRYSRLTPTAQALGITLATGLVCWTVVASAALAVKSLDDSAVSTQIEVVSGAYEARIETLAQELADARASLEAVERRAETAIGQIERLHGDLVAATTERDAANATAEARSERIDALAGERETAVAEARIAIEARIGAEARVAGLSETLAELEGALVAVSSELENTADGRDDALAASSRVAEQLADLQSEVSVKETRQQRLLAQLEDAAELSLGPLEKALENAGVDIDRILGDVRREYSGEGGPFLPIQNASGFAADPDAVDQRVSSILGTMERANLMRIAAEKMPLSRPVRAARFTSGFGSRRDPITGRSSRHDGIDFAAPVGTPIYATADGVVTFSGWQRGYGKVLKIRHAFGFETVYAHNSKLLVKVGDTVSRGDHVTAMGSTGRSTGSHLHYEIRINGNPVNPAKFIEAARDVF